MRRLSLALLALSSVVVATDAAQAKSSGKKNKGAYASSQAEDAPRRIREVPGPVEGQVIVQTDIDGDGDYDIWSHYTIHEDASRTLIRRDADLDGDGKVDIISEFDDTGALTTERIDGDFDSRYEWVDHYQHGARVLTEIDSDGNGTSDMFHYYGLSPEGKQVLERREADTDHDGRIDLWQRYGSDGKLIRAAHDTDGDGKPDTRIE